MVFFKGEGQLPPNYHSKNNFLKSNKQATGGREAGSNDVMSFSRALAPAAGEEGVSWAPDPAWKLLPWKDGWKGGRGKGPKDYPGKLALPKAD